ncbi:MAG: zinc-binding dehydrogenase [Armatimonadia bacterium]
MQITFTAQTQAELLPSDPPAESLQPHQVAGRTLYSVISSGTELAVYQGHHGASYPTGTGYAAVFEVTDVGADVTTLAPGDRAFCMGNHRSWQRSSETETLRVPPGLNPEKAGLARLMGVTMSTLTTTTARPPALVMVTGLGVIGLLGAQNFRAAGYHVIACDPDPARRDFAAATCGLTVYPEPPQDLAGQVALALECSGHEAAALAACNMVRKRGEVVLVGVPWIARTDLTAHTLLHAIFHKYAVVRSGWEWEVPRQPIDFQQGSIFGNIAGALRWLDEGRVQVDGLYQVMSPQDCQAAYQGLMTHTLPRPAVVFDWSSADQ